MVKMHPYDTKTKLLLNIFPKFWWKVSARDSREMHLTIKRWFIASVHIWRRTYDIYFVISDGYLTFFREIFHLSIQHSLLPNLIRWHPYTSLYVRGKTYTIIKTIGSALVNFNGNKRGKFHLPVICSRAHILQHNFVSRASIIVPLGWLEPLWIITATQDITQK